MNVRKMPKILVIGLDGATFDLLDPWMREGRLPNIKKLVDGGARGDFESTVHPLTAPAWASLYTGVNPAKHGVYDFQLYTENSYKATPVNFGSIRRESFWNNLNRAGFTTGLFNLPITYPAKPLDGFMVTGIGSPVNDEPGAHPPEVLAEIKSAAPGYVVEGRHQLFRESVDLFIDDLFETAEKSFRAFLHLLQTRPCDFLMGVFTGTDRAQHFLWKFMDPSHPLHDTAQARKYGGKILELWQRIDRYIGELVTIVPAETDIMLVSDHGFGPLYRDVYINQWLSGKGWLRFRSEKTKDPDVFATALMDAVPFFRKLRLDRDPKLMRLISLCYKRYRDVASEASSDRLFYRFAQPTLLKDDQIDWPGTRAFSNGYIGRIFINTKGRFPQGTVAPGLEYEKMRDEIAAGLRELKTPDGKSPLVDSIRFREDVYHGEYLHEAPDILFTMCGLKYITRQFARHQTADLFGDPDIGESATHRHNGIFVGCGPSFKSGASLDGAHITDFAPTVLYLFGLPVPRDMDGKVLTDAVRPELLDAAAVRISDEAGGAFADGKYAYSAEEEKQVSDMLKGLGYM